MTAPKPNMRRIVLDLRQIHSRCDEEADCLLWRQAVNSGGHPYAWSDGSVVNLRRLVWTLSHPGQELPSWAWLSPTCGNARCLTSAHLPVRTRQQVAKALAAKGAYSSPAATAARTVGRRKGSRLTMEIARAIRLSDEPADRAAQRHGVSKRLVYDIRSGRVWRESAGSVFGLGGSA